MTGGAGGSNMYYMLSEDVSTSKASAIYQWLREEFDGGRIVPGDRLPSENELCERFGASRPSVRQATARLAHEGLVRTERGKGTFRLQPRTTEGRDVAIVLPSLTTYIYPELVSAASRALGDRGYQTLFDCPDGDPNAEIAILERLRERRPAGLVISPTQRSPLPGADSERLASLLRDIRSAGTEVLLLDNTFGDDSFSSIVIDDYGAGKRAAEYLRDRGFGAPAIAWSSNHAPFHERRRGFIDALAARGRPVLSGRELRIDTGNGETRDAAFGVFVSRLAGDPGGAAVFCASDKIAYSLREAAREHGLSVPQDLSLIGFDDSPLARLSEVSLTTFAYPSRFIGERAAALLIDLIEGAPGFARTSICIEPVLVERGSVRVRSES